MSTSRYASVGHLRIVQYDADGKPAITAIILSASAVAQVVTAAAMAAKEGAWISTSGQPDPDSGDIVALVIAPVESSTIPAAILDAIFAKHAPENKPQ